MEYMMVHHIILIVQVQSAYKPGPELMRRFLNVAWLRQAIRCMPKVLN